jgi:hypothetical protein
MKALNKFLMASCISGVLLAGSGCMSDRSTTAQSHSDDAWCSVHPKQCDNKDWCAQHADRCTSAGGN